MTTSGYDEIYRQVVELLRKHAPRPVPIQEDTELVDDLELDSLKVMEMLNDVEDIFDITYPLNALSDLRTVKDFVLQIQSILENG